MTKSDRATIRLRVQPGAKRDAIRDFADGVLRVSVTAPPLEGRANEAVLRFIAEILGVRRSRVSLVSGETSREKVIAIDGLTQAEAVARLNAALSGKR